MSTVKELERIIRTGSEEDELSFRARHPHAAYDHDVKKSLSSHVRAYWESLTARFSKQARGGLPTPSPDTYAADPVVTS